MDFPDTLDREEKLVSKVRWAPPDHPALSDLRVHQERPAPWASAATPDPQVHLESKDFQAPLGRRAPRETPDPLEVLVKTAHLD